VPNRENHTARGAQQPGELFCFAALDQLSHEVHVTAGAESSPFAAQHHHTHMRIASSFFQSFRQIAPHVPDESIETLGPVQRDCDDAVVFGDFD